MASVLMAGVVTVFGGAYIANEMEKYPGWPSVSSARATELLNAYQDGITLHIHGVYNPGMKDIYKVINNLVSKASATKMEAVVFLNALYNVATNSWLGYESLLDPGQGNIVSNTASTVVTGVEDAAKAVGDAIGKLVKPGAEAAATPLKWVAIAGVAGLGIFALFKFGGKGSIRKGN